MTQVEQLAAYVVRATYENLSNEARQQLKIRVLDALGCAIGALDGPPIKMLHAQLEDFGGNPLATLIGGSKTAPDRAALYNSALVRYLDYNDSYLARGETCHPSDNLGAVLAASEYARRSGKDFLTALAVAYQVQCRLSDVAPVRVKGFDHTTQGAYAVAAGVSKRLCVKASGTTLSQTSQHDADHGKVDPCFFTTGEQFVVLGQSAPSGEPGKRSLHHPPARKNMEPLGPHLLPIHFYPLRGPDPSQATPRMFNNLDRPAQRRLDPLDKAAFGVSAIGPDQLEPRKARSERRE